METRRQQQTPPSDDDEKEDEERPQRRRRIQTRTTPFLEWTDMRSTVPEPGKLRLLGPPPTENPFMGPWWGKDRSITEWHTDIAKLERDLSGGALASVRMIYPPNYVENVRDLFARIQRERWLVRKVIRRWRQRVWMRRTQCGVDLIEMEPVPDRDAFFLTDTKIKTIYRFHRRDIVENLLSNLGLADEFLPTPRPPTNPWTNALLTQAQTIGLCSQIAEDYGRKGRSPPVLFAAFCAARFDIDRFRQEYITLLGHLAIVNYFKDVTPMNSNTIVETIFEFLTEARLHYSPMAVRRWFAERPMTPIHREWLTLSRDYTLFMNLHIEPRPYISNPDALALVVRELFSRTPLPDPLSTRVRLIRQEVAQMAYASMSPLDGGLLGIPLQTIIFRDASGNPLSPEQLANLLRGEGES